ncbi:NAD(P)/FAD-dependent oxidoreductase [Jeotgalibacillus campisalis]|uniref:FAD dependent oxidoreductase n=1 Tax=Jeotgalibacillus campisalis TaxID=220754 RepID=A0A0C2VVM9_9BACL|nr:FAD-dependent oxidoreductase [Jeotgalibacillus campisalis]KIL52957.1 FAD dependent oxidoreductase [Jeotgalibacillus campisalis]
MKLHNGELFWPETVEKQIDYPPLNTEVTCDVLIIGGGMAGALCAEELSHTPFKTVLAEKGRIGSGSSSANTGLLQYSNDKMLHEMAEEIGEDQAVHFYKLCLEAVDELQQVSGPLTPPVDFIRRPSLYYASDESDVSKLQKEYEMLNKHGFEVEFYDKELIKERFGFEKPAALMTHGDAEVNPLKLVKALINTANGRDVDVFENTHLTEEGKEGEYWCFASPDGRIKAMHVIYSTGYETISFAKSLGAELNRTFAIATTPVESLERWSYQALIWETKRPYFYMRTTADNRIIAGGLDQEELTGTLDEDVIQDRAAKLLKRIKEHFPDLDIDVSHAWAASFGESKDGLPYIGEHSEKDNIYFCLGYGGNGTVYSKLGAKMLCELIHGKPSEGADIVKLDR